MMALKPGGRPARSDRRRRAAATAVTLGNALLIEQAVIAIDRVPTGNRGQTRRRL